MDVTALRDRIQSTLNPNTSTRQQAELDLKYVRLLRVPGGGPFAVRLTPRGFPSLGRDAARIYQCAAGHFADRAEQCRSAVW